jgi:hypothetical protein
MEFAESRRIPGGRAGDPFFGETAAFSQGNFEKVQNRFAPAKRKRYYDFVCVVKLQSCLIEKAKDCAHNLPAYERSHQEPGKASDPGPFHGLPCKVAPALNENFAKISIFRAFSFLGVSGS